MIPSTKDAETHSGTQRPAWMPYLLAIVFSLLVVPITSGIDRRVGVESSFLLLFAAVLLSALVGGPGPGILAAVLTGTAGGYFCLQAAHISGSSTALLFPLSVYALECAAVITMGAAYHHARHDNARLRRSLEGSSCSDEEQVRGATGPLVEETAALQQADAALAVDNARLYCAAQAEISAREQVQRALETSEERQRLAVEGAEIGTWHWDIRANEQVWSEKCKEMFRLPVDQPVSYASFQARLHPEDRERVAAEVAQAVASKADIANEYRILWPDGSVHWISARGRCYCNASGEAVRFEGIVQNVDVGREAEEVRRKHQAEVEALNQRLRRAMIETHHRVKNNLQVISALIDIQTMEETETLPTSEFKRLSQHVRMLAAVHDLLTEKAKRDSEANSLSARQLLEKFLPLVQQMAYQRRLSFQVEDAILTSDQGTSLALIANEIYSNAIKHGKSEVSIRFYVESVTAIFEVSDDGPGFPPDFDPEREANTGLELVLNLTALDLRGKIQFDNRPEGGGRVRVSFPLPSPPRLTSPLSEP